MIVHLIILDIISDVDRLTSPETASPFNLSNPSTAFREIQKSQVGTNFINV